MAIYKYIRKDKTYIYINRVIDIKYVFAFRN